MSWWRGFTAQFSSSESLPHFSASLYRSVQYRQLNRYNYIFERKSNYFFIRLLTLKEVSLLQDHKNGVWSVAFSPDGKRIVSGNEGNNTLRLWDAETGLPIGEPFKGHQFRVSSVAFSPDSKGIVSGSEDNTLRLWDAVTGQPIGEPLQGHQGNGHCSFQGYRSSPQLSDIQTF